MLLEYKDLIRNNNICIASVIEGGYPTIAVVRAVGVISDHELLITHCEMVKTIKNIMQNNRVCITCFDQNWEGVRIYGTAEYFPGVNEWSEKSREFMSDKSTPVKGAILITAEKVENQS